MQLPTLPQQGLRPYDVQVPYHESALQRLEHRNHARITARAMAGVVFRAKELMPGEQVFDSDALRYHIKKESVKAKTDTRR